MRRSELASRHRLTADGRRQAASLQALLHRVLHGQRAVAFCSPWRRAIDTAALALPSCRVIVEPLVAEHDYGYHEGLTAEEIRRRAPGWDIWRDGCPGGQSTTDVGRRADEFLHDYTENGVQPVVVVTHERFSQILAARALRLAPEEGRLLASEEGSVSVIEDHHGERCVGFWNADAVMLPSAADQAAPRHVPSRSAGHRWRATAMTHRHQPSVPSRRVVHRRAERASSCSRSPARSATSCRKSPSPPPRRCCELSGQ